MKFNELDNEIRQCWHQDKSKAEILYEIIMHVIVFIYELEIADL